MSAPAAIDHHGGVTDAAALGRWLRAARLNLGVSQRALAERAGLSRSYLSDIERGREVLPSVPTLDRLAVALGASRLDVLRAAGFLESSPPERRSDGDERLLTLVRALSADGRSTVERFVRFLYQEEHRWVQPALADDLVGDDGGRRADRPVADGGPRPTLFDALVDVADETPGRVDDGRPPEGIGA